MVKHLKKVYLDVNGKVKAVKFACIETDTRIATVVRMLRVGKHSTMTEERCVMSREECSSWETIDVTLWKTIHELQKKYDRSRESSDRLLDKYLK